MEVRGWGSMALTAASHPTTGNHTWQHVFHRTIPAAGDCALPGPAQCHSGPGGQLQRRHRTPAATRRCRGGGLGSRRGFIAKCGVRGGGNPRRHPHIHRQAERDAKSPGRYWCCGGGAAPVPERLAGGVRAVPHRHQPDHARRGGGHVRGPRAQYHLPKSAGGPKGALDWRGTGASFLAS